MSATPATAFSLVQARLGAKFPGRSAAISEANMLGDEEFDSSMALLRLGHYAAHQAAWERRTAARELAKILIHVSG